MAVDKLVDSTQLDSDLTSVANAIRTKGGTSAQLAFPAGFVSAIGDIQTGGLAEIDSYEFNIPTELSSETSGTDAFTVATLPIHQALTTYIHDNYYGLSKTDHPFVLNNNSGLFCLIVTPKNLSEISAPPAGITYYIRKEMYCRCGYNNSTNQLYISTPQTYRVFSKTSTTISLLATLSTTAATTQVVDGLTPKSSENNILITAKLDAVHNIAAGDYVVKIYDLTNMVL